MPSSIDHLVITAPSLEAGAEHVCKALGVEPQAGGGHLLMGTHNLLLRLGDTTYLEILAIDPRAERPARPRWFGLDQMAPTSQPRLRAWVARTNDLRVAAAASPFDLGTIEEAHRGALRWLIPIPADGRAPADGVAPVLIQWLSETHPASTLRGSGCSLIQLTGHHPDPDRIGSMLSHVGFDGPFSVVSTLAGEEPHLVARLQTPGGIRVLGSNTPS